MRASLEGASVASLDGRSRTNTDAIPRPTNFDQESLLCNHPHAMAKSPSETMYCEPLSNTALIIVMVFLLSGNIHILKLMTSPMRTDSG